MKIIVNGAAGHMGSILCGLIEKSEEHGIFAKADRKDSGFPEIAEVPKGADVIIDFSHHTAVGALLDYAKENGIPTVVATTGHTPEELAMIAEAAKTIPVFRSANMSLGIAVLSSVAKQAAAMFPDADIEIIEKHHNRKLDAPSGTALLLANELKTVRTQSVFKLGRAGAEKREKNEIGIHAVRAGNIVGEHEIILCNGSETLTLKHEAHDRALFAEGALKAAEFLVSQKAGLYDMKNIF